jgi:WD40 repeat protein
MRLLPAGSGQLEILAYSPDGSHLVASAAPGPRVCLWDLRADQVRFLKEPPAVAPFAPRPPRDYLAPLAWSPSGEFLAAAAEGQVSLRDSRTGVERYFANATSHQSHRLAFAPDGQTLVSAGYDDEGGPVTAVVLWDVASAIRRKLATGFRGGTDALAISGDASLVLWHQPPARGVPCQLTLWNVPGRRALARLRFAASPACATFSPSGRQLALGLENTIHLYEIGHVLDFFGVALSASNPWSPVRLPIWWRRFGSRLPPLGNPKVLEGHGDGVRTLAYAPDGTSLLSAGRDLTVRCWDVASGRQRDAWGWPVGNLSALAVAPDGMTAAAGGDTGRAIIWDLTWF